MDKMKFESPDMTAPEHRPHCCPVSELRHGDAG